MWLSSADSARACRTRTRLKVSSSRAQAAAAESGRPLPLAMPAAKEPSRASAESISFAPPPSSPNPTSGTSESLDGAAPQRAKRATNAHFTNPDDEFRSQLVHNEAYMFERFERRLRRLLISERERGGTLIDAL